MRSSPLPHSQVISSMFERPLVARIRRILKLEEQSMQVSRKMVGLVLARVIGMALVIGGYCSRAGRAEDKAAAVSDKQQSTAWSDTLNGLRLRLLAPQGTTYRRGAILPLVAEVQNNSDQPIAGNKLCWHTVGFLSHDGDAKPLGMYWMGPEMGDWVGHSADLAPGEVTLVGLSFQSVRFLRPLKAGETIQLQAVLPRKRSARLSFPWRSIPRCSIFTLRMPSRRTLATPISRTSGK